MTDNDVSELGRVAPTVGSATPLGGPASASSATALLDEVLKDLRQLHLTEQSSTLQTGANSVLASIQDAIALVQVWPSDIPAPRLDFDDDGLVSIEVLQGDGVAIAALDFPGAEHIAAYSIVSGNLVVCSGNLKPTCTTEAVQFFSKLRTVAA